MTQAVRPAPPRSSHCTHDALRRLMRRLSTHYDARLRPAGLKTTQYSLLARVGWLGPLRPVDLADAMGLDASTLTRNLKPLMQAGWVVQEPGADARSRLVRLTDEGRVKLAEGRALWRKAQSSLNEILGPDRVEALHAVLEESLDLLPHETGTNDGARDD
jgi:DNA-binding MarR family transcriptional regulator